MCSSIFLSFYFRVTFSDEVCRRILSCLISSAFLYRLNLVSTLSVFGS